MTRSTPSYVGLKPASETASRAHSRSSHSDTACERALRSALWRMGFRFRKNVKALPGKPDIVFTRQRVAIFCDGDFWHGKDWELRKAKLKNGTNPSYWVKKIETNIARDQRHNAALAAEGWAVLRVWESEIRADLEWAAKQVAGVLERRTTGAPIRLPERSSRAEKRSESARRRVEAGRLAAPALAAFPWTCAPPG